MTIKRKTMFVTQKLGIKLLQVGKIMKIKHSVSSPLQGISGGGGGNFFLKKLCMRKQTSLGKFVGDLLGESFTNGNSFELSSNLNTVNLRILPGYDDRDIRKYIFTSL